MPDGPSAFLPNSKIWGETIVSLSVTTDDRRRIDERIGISIPFPQRDVHLIRSPGEQTS